MPLLVFEASVVLDGTFEVFKPFVGVPTVSATAAETGMLATVVFEGGFEASEVLDGTFDVFKPFVGVPTVSATAALDGTFEVFKPFVGVPTVSATAAETGMLAAVVFEGRLLELAMPILPPAGAAKAGIDIFEVPERLSGVGEEEEAWEIPSSFKGTGLLLFCRFRIELAGDNALPVM
jgi:hypothetical protein